MIKRPYCDCPQCNAMLRADRKSLAVPVVGITLVVAAVYGLILLWISWR